MARPPRPEPIDRLLVRLGHAVDQDEARALLAAGLVRVDGAPVTPAARVRPGRELTVGPRGVRWVGRGAAKLAAALDAFGVDPRDRVAADLGASTGGFTQVLLQRGARRVFAVDVGRGLLDWGLRADPRVVVLEGTHARDAALPEAVSLLVADLSFISVGAVLLAIRRLTAPGGDAIVLVKPQFEVAPRELTPGGRVADPQARHAAITHASAEAVAAGFSVRAGVDSAIPGARSGNIEHFLWLQAPGWP